MDIGDIIVISGTGWLARMIRRLDKTPASHVALVISTDPPLVIEAVNRVKTTPLRTALERAERYWVLEAQGFKRSERRAIVNAACEFSTVDYGFLKLALQLLDIVFRTRWFTRNFTWTRHPICSYLVAEAYDVVDLDFGAADESIRPSDILAFATANPDKYIVTECKGVA